MSSWVGRCYEMNRSQLHKRYICTMPRLQSVRGCLTSVWREIIKDSSMSQYTGSSRCVCEEILRYC